MSIYEYCQNDCLDFVQALTNSNKLHALLFFLLVPKSVTLSLSPDYQTINASWTIDGNFEKFEVTIQTAPYTHSRVECTVLRYYYFEHLNAGVNYNISVVTINGNLRSQPTNNSDFTSE